MCKHNNTFWSDNKVNNQDHNVSESNLIEYVKFLVDNIYIQVADRVYKQKIGMYTDGNRLCSSPSKFILILL